MDHSDELFAAIGRVAMHFQHLEEVLDVALIKLLGIEEGWCSEVVLAGKTVGPRLDMLMACTKVHTSVRDREAWKTWGSKAREIVAERNRLFHDLHKPHPDDGRVLRRISRRTGDTTLVTREMVDGLNNQILECAGILLALLGVEVLSEPADAECRAQLQLVGYSLLDVAPV